ncbi:MAG: FAD-dependent oxidoreductase [Opitutales bacterium]
MSDSTKTITMDTVILGGGFAGAYCAKTIGQMLPPEEAKTTALISEDNYLVFQPMLPEVAGSALASNAVVNPLRTFCRGVSVFKGRVKEIDYEKKEVLLNAGSFSPKVSLKFKRLVLALGAEIDLSRVPGMPEHAFLMQNVGDAMKLRATIIGRFEEANIQTDPEIKKRLLTFVVVGGGYSGVETAGQIVDLFHGITKFYTNISEDEFRVVLIHSRDVLLPTLSEKLGRYAEKMLRQRGLDILLNRRVKALTSKQVYLDNGDIIESHCVVSTVGTAPHSVIRDLCDKFDIKNFRGRIETDNTMKVVGTDYVYAAGDCAAVPLWKSEETCAPTAQFAMRQGVLLGKNLVALQRDKKPKPFKFTGLGELAAIGHRTAVASVMGINFSGFIAWFMWRSIYLSKLPGVDRKLRVMIDWTLDLFFPRDINVISPRYTRSLQEVYLEEGNILFNPGEPAFSFYVVKTGRIDIVDGDELIKTIRAGEFFGERALFEDDTWRFQAVAKQATTLIALSSGEFKAVMGTSTYFQRLLKRSAQQYRTTEDLQSMFEQLPDSLLSSPVSEQMIPKVSSIPSNTTVAQTLSIFKETRHTIYPVTEPETEKLLGVFRRDDFYDYIKQKGVTQTSDLSALNLRDVPQVHPMSEVSLALEIMVREGANKVMVTEDSKTVGIITIMDILGDIEESEREEIAEKLTRPPMPVS